MTQMSQQGGMGGVEWKVGGRLLTVRIMEMTVVDA
jgi:hypothetical protein